MNVNGTYRISIEMSARKQAEGLLTITNRLLGIVTDVNAPKPPDKEEHIQDIIKMMKSNQEIIDSISLTITEDLIVLRTDEGSLTAKIERREEEKDGKVTIYHNSEDWGQSCWKLTLCDNYLFLDSEDELSDYVFESDGG